MTKTVKLTQYKGLCDTFGQNTVSLSAFGLPIAVNAAALTAVDELSFATSLASLIMSFAGLSYGFDAACETHSQLNKSQSKKKIDFETGSTVVRAEQMRAYSKKMGAALALNLAVVCPIVDQAEDLFWEHHHFDRSNMTIVRH